MPPKSLVKISLAVAAEAGDSVVEMLSDLLGKPASSYTDADTGATLVTVYLDGPSEDREKLKAEASEGLARIARCGLDVSPGTIEVNQIRREDWADSWKKHFKPIPIGSALLIKPSWSQRKPVRGQKTVILDPGLSFGTGQHPTTRFCLRQLAIARKTKNARSFLDIGTGSGILAIAAAKLGYRPVHAFDFDPDAVRIARANAKLNSVLELIRLQRSDLTLLPMRSKRTFEVICANLMFDLLLQERTRILNRLAPGGRLILAGILATQFPSVEAALVACGLKLIASKTEGEWRSGAFSRSESSK
jgi:ribosomal protein L11 methyltransferase